MIRSNALYVFVLIILALEAIARLSLVDHSILPLPSASLNAVASEGSTFFGAWLFTISNALLGLLIALSVAFVISTISTLSMRGDRTIGPIIDFMQSFPKESLFPVFFVWFGFGAAPKIVNAALLSVIPLAVVMRNALRNPPTEGLELVRSWGASRWQEFLWCRVPYAVPSFHSALRLSIPLAIVGSVLGEFMGGGAGLGSIIMTSGSIFRVDRLFGAIYLLAATGLCALSVVDGVFAATLSRYFWEEK